MALWVWRYWEGSRRGRCLVGGLGEWATRGNRRDSANRHRSGAIQGPRQYEWVIITPVQYPVWRARLPRTSARHSARPGDAIAAHNHGL